MHCATIRTCTASVLATLLLTSDGASATTPQCGKGSWYEFTGRTASGEAADPDGLTAAHPTLPFGTRVEVKNLRNGRTVEVRVNDRGPHTGGRIIDLSRAAAEAIGMVEGGISNVRVAVAGEQTSAQSCR
jgi:rare lipoprotein A